MGILESLVTPMIRGVMEKFFENFDSERLDINLGTVELNDMLIKPSLLDDYGVPLKLVFGKVGKVSVDFVVSTLITDFMSKSRDVVVELKDVYILLAPPTSVRYSENKGDGKAAKRKALEEAILNDPDLTVGPPAAADTNATFLMGIINNIKITVENIHIRYEDEVTNPGSTFAIGITLKKFIAVSTDDKWKPTPTDKTGETFFKLVSLQDLGVYWNSKTVLLRPKTASADARTASVVKMKQLIDTDNHELNYIVGHLNGSAKAIVTLKPNKLEKKFSKPLADVVLCLDNIDIDLTNEQFHDGLLLMESLEDIARQRPYLSFRPFGLPHHGYPKQWWKYAYECARVGVKRRNRLYDTDYFAKQKRLCDEYELAYADYRQKITLKTATDAEKQKFMDLEDSVGNQDILIIRKRVALKDKSVVAQQETKSGWLSYYKVALSPEKLKKVLEETLTEEEMKEVQQYIDFAPEDADARNFPPGYTQIKVEFELPKFTTTVRQVQKSGPLDVFQLCTKEISTKFELYPAEQGMWGELTLGSMRITGVPSGGEIPSFAKSLTSGDKRFVVCSYAQNPRGKKPGKYLDCKCDRTEVIYDSPTIQKLIDCFTWPSGVELQKTTAAVGSAMANASNMSVAGLKEMIQNTEEIFVDITCMAPFILIPSRGNMHKADTILAINAGKLTLQTIPRERSITDGRSIENVGVGSDLGDISMEIQKLTYNHYVATYVDVECYVALKGEDIMAAINHTFPPDKGIGVYHTDRPVQFFKAEKTVMSVDQCIIKDDTRFPQLKVAVSVPLLDFQLTDYRALKLVRLLATIPLPLMKPASSAFLEGVEDPNFYVDTDVDELIKEHILVMEQEKKEDSPEKETKSGDLPYDAENAPQFTALMAEIHVKLVKVLLLRLNEVEKSTTPLLDCNFHEATATSRFRSYGMSFDLTIGSATVAYLDATVQGQVPGTPVYLLHTPHDTDRPLCKLHFFSMSDDSPRSTGGQVHQKITLTSQCVTLTLHQESLEGLVLLADRVIAEFANSEFLKAKKQKTVSPIIRKKRELMADKVKKIGIKNLPNQADILIRANALLNKFKLSLVSSKRNIAMFYVGSVIAEFEDRPLKSIIFAQISDVEMTNLQTPSFYSGILKSGPEVPLMVTTVYIHKETFHAEHPDIEVLFNLTCPPVLCIGDYAGNIVDFFTHLQVARNTFKDVAATTTIAAMSAAKDVYATEKKLLLDIKFISPKLIFVRSALSLEAVVLDLGKLTVKNKLQEIPTPSARSAVLDQMDIALEGLSITRVLMDRESQDIKAGVHLLEPVGIKVNIQRSLSPWYKTLPSININGQLDTTEVKLSSLDVEVAATCILNYAGRVQRSLKRVTSTDVVDEVPPEKGEGDGNDEDRLKKLIGGKADEDMEAYKFGLKFTIVKIGLSIFQQVTLLDGMTGTVHRDLKGCLAEFYLETMELDFKKWGNKDMDIILSLDEILLRDKRPTAGDIKDFLVKKVDPNDPHAPFLHLTFSTKNIRGQSTTYIVNATTQGVFVILYLEFMKLLLDFGLSATKSIPKGDDDLKVEDGNSVKLDKKRSILMGRDNVEDDSAETEPGEVKEGLKLPLIKGTVNFHRTEVLILENIHSKETNSLIGYGSVLASMDSENGKGSWGEGSWNFGIITAKYSPDKPKEQVIDVLRPVELKIKAQITPQSGTALLLVFSDFYLQVNAGTILLLAKIGNSLQAVIAAYKQKEANAEIGRKDYADVWGSRLNVEQDYWFLDFSGLTTTTNRLKGKELDTLTELVTEAQKLPQKLEVQLPRSVIILETGVSTKPTPMVLADGHLFLNATDWTTNLAVQLTTGGCIYYNNITKGTWEYLIEPNEDQRGAWTPWELQINASKKTQAGGKPAMLVTVSSSDLLEVTISKTSMELMKALVENFADSIKFGINEEDINNPPYVFKNDVSTDVWIQLNVGQTGLTYTTGTHVLEGGVLVAPGQSLELGMELQDIRTSASDQKERLFSIFIPEFMNFRTIISVRYNGTRFFQLRDNQGNEFGILMEIKAQKNFSTLIVARSIVQLTSELSLPVDVTAIIGKSEVAIGRLEPYKIMNFPLAVLRSGVVRVGLQFKAAGYHKSTKSQAFAALARVTDKTRDFVVSKAEMAGAADGKIRVIGSVEMHPIDGMGSVTGKTFKLLLKPPLVVNNFLTMTLGVSTDGKYFIPIEPGNPMDILTASTDISTSYLVLMLQGFQGANWTASVRLKLRTTRDSVLFRASDAINAGEINSLEFKSETGRKLYFRFRPTVYEGRLEEISIFAPYWMVNRTELSLYYQGASSRDSNSRVTHDPKNPEPIMMAYDVDGAEKGRFCIADSDWSQAMNLDTPMGVDIDCKGKESDYEVIVSIELSPSNLTKTVSFLPKFHINNTCSFDVTVSQSGKFGSEIIVPAKTTIPFWPKGRVSEPVDLLLKIEGTEDYTSSFRFDGINISLLKLNNKFGGLLANVNVLSNKGTLTISEFDISGVPLLIVNDTSDLEMSFHQVEVGIERSIPAHNSVVYSWDDLKKGYKIEWRIPSLLEDTGFPKQFEMDTPTSGEFTTPDAEDEEKTKIYYWSVFVSGLRTILVLTGNKALLPLVEEYLEMGKANKLDPEAMSGLTLEAIVQFEGFGISILDDQACKDVIYIRLESMPPMWEATALGGNRFRTLPAAQIQALEIGFVKYVTGKNTATPVKLEGGIVVDYANFIMSAPKKQQLKRHAYKPGLFARFRLYEFSKELNLSVAKLQIDNQLQDTEFPNLFIIAPIPKSVSTQSEIPLPLLLVDYRDWSPGGSTDTIQGKVILQEFMVAVDTSMIKSVLAIFSHETTKNVSPQTKALYDYDYKRASLPDIEYYKLLGEKSSAESQVAIYELLQAYKLKIRVTASLSKDPDGDYFQNLLLGLGSGVVSVTDVPLTIDGLEIHHKRWTKQQLMDTVIQHYKSGVMRNLYKFVLGLDLLGNPSKLLGGIGSGLSKLITEPIQGAREGNFMGGMSSGAGAAFDGTIVGVTDTLGTVTKQVGKLTSGMGLPVVGRLLQGISGSLQSVGSVVGEQQETNFLRPRRIMNPNQALKPYSLHNTIGETVYQKMWNDYSNPGNHISHYIVADPVGNLEILVIAVNRVYCASSSPKLEFLNRQWTYAWTELDRVDQAPYNGVKFTEPRRGMLGILPVREQVAYMSNPETAADALQKCTQAWTNARRK